MHTMKPPFDNCRSYDGISAFFEQHKYRVIRFYVYRRMFTPQEVEKQYIDQSVYESNTASISMVREVISLPDGDVLLGIGGIYEDVCDMDHLEYYRLSEIRLSYWPRDDYEYRATDEQSEEEE